MNADAYIIDAETGKKLKVLGGYTYDNTSRLFSNLEEWFFDDIMKLENDGVVTDLLLEDC